MMEKMFRGETRDRMKDEKRLFSIEGLDLMDRDGEKLGDDRRQSGIILLVMFVDCRVMNLRAHMSQ